MALLDAGADTPRTVLFVGHDAFRAGAQIEMLHLLRWLHDHSDLRIRTLLKRGGELVPDYRAVEAAAMSIPIVCFLDAGGLPEFVGDDAGIAVPYLDVEAAASAVATLAASADLRQQLGQCAAGRVKAAHDIGAAGNRILGVINRLTRQRPA